jgi:hypothetical protein
VYADDRRKGEGVRVFLVARVPLSVEQRAEESAVQHLLHRQFLDAKAESDAFIAELMGGKLP